ncbi:MAG TPA: hypothetical protein VJ785_05720 [Anaerolineales bacterium]|nr:hypothetical protein [Anaerolineales bacterium]
MSTKLRTTFLSLAIITVLVFSAVSPLTVYADDGPPPEETPTAVTDKPDDTSTEEASETEKSTEEATDPQATETAVPAEGEVAPAEAEVAAEPVLTEVPENTAVTVLDANGDAQPLATEAAADAIATSDPIWCPGAQAPTPGQNGCTQSFTSFDDLLTHMSGNVAYQGIGTIYVQQGTYSGNDPNHVIDFNSAAYDLSNISNSNLTVTGGWNTSNNTIDPSAPSTFTNYSIIIGSSTNPWGGSLTISNISMNLSGVTDPQFQTDGMTLHTDGDIWLSNISVTVAPNNGVELHAGGDVNVINSSFERNRQRGALIRAAGNVNIANSTFGNPRPDRGRLQDFGLDIESGEATSLFNVISNNNRQAGTTINSAGRVTIGSSFFNATMEMLGPRGQRQFLGYGLQVITPDAIDIDNVTANDNFLWGALLDAGGDIAISNSVFNHNSTDEPRFIDDTGLFITGGQNVALNNVTANDNRLYGAQINVDGTVSINNSFFNNNRGVTTIGGVTNYHGQGLQINTPADIFINNTEAVNNTLFGGQMTAGGEVAVSNSNFSDTSTTLATSVVGQGLEIVSTGNSSLSNVILNNNQSVGADIQAGGDIFLDTVTAVDNATDGVAVQASCTRVSGGLYSGNDQYGLNLGTSGLEILSPAIFNNNTAGDINPATPASCPPPVVNNPPDSGGTPGTGGTPNEESTPVESGGTTVINSGSAAGSSGAANLFAGSFASGVSSDMSSRNVSLSSYLANAKTGNGSLHGIFFGKYIYVDSDEGLQIFAIHPEADNHMAKTGS